MKQKQASKGFVWESWQRLLWLCKRWRWWFDGFERGGGDTSKSSYTLDGIFRNLYEIFTWNLYKILRNLDKILRNISKSYEIFRNNSKCYAIFTKSYIILQNLTKYCKILRNLAKSYEISQNIFKDFESSKYLYTFFEVSPPRNQQIRKYEKAS